MTRKQLDEWRSNLQHAVDKATSPSRLPGELDLFAADLQMLLARYRHALAASGETSYEVQRTDMAPMGSN
jgi:hypothetical protein